MAKKYTPAQTAAHYRGLARGAERAKAMKGSGGGRKPPKKGCALILIAGLGLGILQLAGLAEIVMRMQ